VLQVNARARSSGEPFEVEYRITTRGGQRKHIREIGYARKNGDGVVSGLFGTAQDITERKQTEQVLRQSADHLQRLSRRLLEVQEEERRHLARELHDEFGQLLATITLYLHAAKGLAGEAAQSWLEECATLLKRAGEEVRSLALELRPTMLETAGLEATLRWLAEQHQQRTGMATQVVGHMDGVSGDLAIACFRVVQEALTNTVRHAVARHVFIELSRSENALELVVRDDGVGFDVDRTLQQAAQNGRLGLSGMRERVQILGGSLEVDSAPGRGTHIRTTFPLADGAAEPAGPAE
jgi:two-component system sensor histidine kinase UhpB